MKTDIELLNLFLNEVKLQFPVNFKNTYGIPPGLCYLLFFLFKMKLNEKISNDDYNRLL